MIKEYMFLVAKGLGIGAANIIPGVSGGTIALVTGIFQRLIDSIKSMNFTALKLIGRGKFKEFALHVDLYFLLAVFAGVIISILSLTRLLGYLFLNYPIFVWSYFFGLIMASVYYVGKTVKKWTTKAVILLLASAFVAALLSFLNPASPNDSFLYLVLCGVVGICSMILPGISGSFVLLLMGNYQLVVIDAVNNFDLRILLPVALGAVGGLLAFSHFLSWLYKNYRDETISTLTGFIFGSLMIIWPWKNAIFLSDERGNEIIRNGKKVVQGYELYVPEFNEQTIWAFLIVLAGILTVIILEKLVEGTNQD